LKDLQPKFPTSFHVRTMRFSVSTSCLWTSVLISFDCCVEMTVKGIHDREVCVCASCSRPVQGTRVRSVESRSKRFMDCADPFRPRTAGSNQPRYRWSKNHFTYDRAVADSPPCLCTSPSPASRCRGQDPSFYLCVKSAVGQGFLMVVVGARGRL
jgi:hypothetical protein